MLNHRHKRYEPVGERGQSQSVTGYPINTTNGKIQQLSFSGSDPSGTNTSGGLPNRIANGNLPTGQRSTCLTIRTSLLPGSPG